MKSDSSGQVLCMKRSSGRPEHETGIWARARLRARDLSDEAHIAAPTAAQVVDAAEADDSGDHGPIAA